MVELVPIPVIIGAKAGYTLDCSLVKNKTHAHTLVSLECMTVGGNTHKQRERENIQTVDGATDCSDHLQGRD